MKGEHLVKLFLQKKSHNAEKIERGDPLGNKISNFFEIFEKTKNENFEQSHSAEILKRGDPLGTLVCCKKF